MKYYYLKTDDREEIMGEWPQCKPMPSKYNYTKWFENKNSMTKLSPFEFPSENPDLVFELEEEAPLTDVIKPTNITGKGFLFNEKVKNIFEKCRITTHKFYPATVIFSNNDYTYWWLYLLPDFKAFDFPKSQFCIKPLFSEGNLGDIQLIDEDDYLKRGREYVKEEKNICPKKLVLSADAIRKPYDLIYSFESRVFISQNLMQMLESAGVVGFRFYEQTLLE